MAMTVFLVVLFGRQVSHYGPIPGAHPGHIEHKLVVHVVLYLLAPIYSCVLARTRVSTRNAFLW